MRTDTAYGRARPPHPRRFAVLVHAFVWRCAGRWPSLCTMHAPLPCNCRCLISGSSRRLPSPGMRRRALHTCIRKHVPGPHPILARRLCMYLDLACQRCHCRMWLCNRLVLPLWGVQGVQDGSWERVLLHLRRKTGTGCVCHRLQNATERLIDTCVFVCALGHRLFASHPPTLILAAASPQCTQPRIQHRRVDALQQRSFSTTRRLEIGSHFNAFSFCWHCCVSHFVPPRIGSAL